MKSRGHNVMAGVVVSPPLVCAEVSRLLLGIDAPAHRNKARTPLTILGFTRSGREHYDICGERSAEDQLNEPAPAGS